VKDLLSMPAPLLSIKLQDKGDKKAEGLNHFTHTAKGMGTLQTNVTSYIGN